MILRALCLENKQEDMSEKLEELISSMCRENLEDVPGLEELLEVEVRRGGSGGGSVCGRGIRGGD